MTPINTDGQWIQLAPIGEFPNGHHVQRITPAIVAKLVTEFNGALAKLSRIFVGVPVYIGHPDNPAFEDKFKDGRAYGWIKELEDRGAEGLWGRVQWSDQGEQIVANRLFQYVSPNWRGLEKGGYKGLVAYEPFRLLSVGLTNQPNLPVLPLANEEQAAMPKLIEVLGLAETATADEIIERTVTLANTAQASAARITELEAAGAATVAATTAENARLTVELANVQTASAALQERLDAQRRLTAQMLLTHAQASGRITAGQNAELLAAHGQDPDAMTVALANIKPAVELHTDAITKDLGNKRVELDTEQSRQRLRLEKLNEYQASGLDYEQAWFKLKRECPQLTGRSPA